MITTTDQTTTDKPQVGIRCDQCGRETYVRRTEKIPGAVLRERRCIACDWQVWTTEQTERPAETERSGRTVRVVSLRDMVQRR